METFAWAVLAQADCRNLVMLLFAGLGNPGRQHAGQRHNIGFMALDAIARVHRAAPFRAKFQGLVSEAQIAGTRVILLKPETYMNESGRSVREALSFYKLTSADLTVFHDELDIAPGTLRVKTGGGNAGHNGLRSITAEAGNDYRRVRLGIGHPGAKHLVLNYVLGDFTKSEKTWLDALCDATADYAGDLVTGDIVAFQNKVHQKLPPAIGG